MFWSEAEKVTRLALAEGSLVPIATDPSEFEQNGIHYVLHTKNENAAKKIAQTQNPENPFFPYEQDMFVGSAGDSHVCLLNKFPVLSPHLLICSRTFVEQVQPLTIIDFKAWLLGFDDPDILGFYNGGTKAGASQHHRHMQLVKTVVPMEEKFFSRKLPFRHWFIRLENMDAVDLFNAYQRGMNQLGLFGESECHPHNLLMTMNWMLIVPRSKESLNGIFVNGLNYAGFFLIKNNEKAKYLKDYGLLRVLIECSEAGSICC